MAVFVIHGPPASGKTRNGEAFRKHLKARRVIEHDSPAFAKVRDGDLVLTTHLHDVQTALKRFTVTAYSIAAAKKWL